MWPGINLFNQELAADEADSAGILPIKQQAGQFF
jgi:hypothetical protein